MPIAKLNSSEIYYLDQPANSHSTVNPDDIPVVLIHGFASSVRDNWLDTGWINFLTEQGFRIIALDNRGHGKSTKYHTQEDYSLELMADDVIELLDYLNVDVAHMMGYSMGARIASLLAMQYPQRVARLVLGGNGYGMIEGTGDWTPVKEGLLAASMDDVVDLRARAFRRFAQRTGSDRIALANCVMGLRKTFTQEEFRQIRHQTLVAVGTEDDIAGSGEKLAHLMQNAVYFPIEGRDHMRASTDKTFKRAAAEFLQ